MIDIKENSKVIAEFMGIHVLKGETTDNDGNTSHYYYYNNFEEQDYDALPSYNISWDAIMPVVGKITNRDTRELNQEGSNLYNDVCSNLFVADIETTYKTVINFITWYNKNK